MAFTPRSQVLNPLGGFNLVPQDAAQIVTVAKSGAMFTTIQDALNSITDASISKQYLIKIAPGSYSGFIAKPYVSYAGESTGTGNTLVTGNTTLVSGTLAEDATQTVAHIGFLLTPTTDNQRCIDVVGNFGMIDCFTFVQATTNVETGNIRINTASLFAISATSHVYANTFASSKDYIGVEVQGAGQVFTSVSSVRVTTNAASGVHRLFRQTGTNEIIGTTFNEVYKNTNAAFSGEVRGACINTATTNNRIFEYCDWRFEGSGAGTVVACRMDSSSASGQIFYSGLTISISGFTAGQEYLSNTATTDTQKIWLASQNKDLSKTGTGISVITPYDHAETGFVSWGSGTTYWSYDSGTKALTINRRGAGIVKGSPATWAAGQTVTLTNLATNYIYMTSAGIIGVTTTSSKALYRDNIVLLEAWVQGTNIIVVNEAHPYEFTTAVSHAWHNLFGPLLQDATQTLAINSGAGRTVNIVGTNTLNDHGLDTSVAAQTPATWFQVVTGTGGKAYLIATSSALGSKKSNPANTTGTDVTNGRRLVIRLGVIKDSVNSSSAQFVAMADTTDYASLSAANNAITAGTIATFPAEIKALEVAQLGFAIINANGLGGGTLEQVTTALQVFGAQFVSGGTSTSGSLITLNTTNFDGQLNGTESNDQAAWDRIDDYGYIGTYATGVEYRVGNAVVQNGCVYRCTVLVTSVSNTAWTAVKASFTQVSIARYADVTAAEAANANDTNLFYVVSTDTFYRYVSSGSAYTRDGTYVLNTGDAGNTRMIAVAGKYCVNTPYTSCKANYVINPTALTGTASCTGSNATIARSTTTPLSSLGTEWNITSTSTPWSATWALNAFPEGMKNRLGEVSMVIRGTAAGTTTLTVVQNSISVFSQTVTLDANNPKKIGGTFPIGDLANATTIVLSGTGATTGAIEVGDVYIGEPVSVTSGQITTEWQAFTPTITGSVSNPTKGTATETAIWRRVGSSIEIEYSYIQTVAGSAGSGSYYWSLPNGLQIDTAKASGYPGKNTAYAYNGTTEYVGFSVAQTATTIRIDVQNALGSTSYLSSTNMSLGNATARIVFRASFPIVGWQATDIVTPEASLVEYAAWNSTGVGTGSVVKGEAGGLVATDTPAGTSETFDITSGFSSIKPTDTFIIEYLVGGTGSVWGSTSEAQKLRYDGANFVGFDVRANSNTVNITRGKYRHDGSRPWSETSANSRWRVKKIPASGSQSFYMQGPVKGGNSGAGIAAGYIGEKVTTTISNSASLVTNTVTPVATLTLNKGRWQIFGKLYFEIVAAVTSVTRRTASISTSNTAMNTKSNMQSLVTTIDVDDIVQPCPIVVDVTSDSTPVYLNAYATFVVGTGSMRANGANTEFYAIRVGD